MALDLAHRHAARIHRHDLLVEARETPLITRDQFGIERPLAVARYLEVELRRLGQQCLFRIAIAVIPKALRSDSWGIPYFSHF
jgi:hypothetical protein